MKSISGSLRETPCGDLVVGFTCATSGTYLVILQLRAAGAIASLPIKTIDIAMCATACESRKLYGQVSIIQRAFSLLTLSNCLETLNLHQYYGIMSDERDVQGQHSLQPNGCSETSQEPPLQYT
jgi:hypothetical protein